MSQFPALAKQSFRVKRSDEGKWRINPEKYVGNLISRPKQKVQEDERGVENHPFGCGISVGVSVWGVLAGAYATRMSQNRRQRCALLVQSGTTTILVDAGPDIATSYYRLIS